MATHDHIAALIQNAEDRAKIVQRIRDARCTISVAFTDLCNSTAIKRKLNDDEWLVHLYVFVTAIEDLVRRAGGRPAKRLGDGILATFPSTQESESFLAAVREDPRLQGTFRFRTSLDHGLVHEMFGDGDPYGTPVDRCARMVALAAEGTVLASADYVDALAERTCYSHLGVLPLKGIDDPTTIFISNVDLTREPETYLASLIQQLNSDAARRDSFRSVGRRFAPSDFRIKDITEISPKPFLLRELLLLPRLPFTFREFLDLLRADEAKALEAVGYIVEWSGVVSSRSVEEYCVWLTVRPEKNDIRIDSAMLCLPIFAKDILQAVPEDAGIVFRGVLTGIFIGSPQIDFVEILQIPSADAESPGGA